MLLGRSAVNSRPSRCSWAAPRRIRVSMLVGRSAGNPRASAGKLRSLQGPRRRGLRRRRLRGSPAPRLPLGRSATKQREFSNPDAPGPLRGESVRSAMLLGRSAPRSVPPHHALRSSGAARRGESTRVSMLLGSSNHAHRCSWAAPTLPRPRPTPRVPVPLRFYSERRVYSAKQKKRTQKQRVQYLNGDSGAVKFERGFGRRAGGRGRGGSCSARPFRTAGRRAGRAPGAVGMQLYEGRGEEEGGRSFFFPLFFSGVSLPRSPRAPPLVSVIFPVGGCSAKPARAPGGPDEQHERHAQREQRGGQRTDARAGGETKNKDPARRRNAERGRSPTDNRHAASKFDRGTAPKFESGLARPFAETAFGKALGAKFDGPKRSGTRRSSERRGERRARGARGARSSLFSCLPSFYIFLLFLIPPAPPPRRAPRVVAAAAGPARRARGRSTRRGPRRRNNRKLRELPRVGGWGGGGPFRRECALLPLSAGSVFCGFWSSESSARCTRASERGARRMERGGETSRVAVGGREVAARDACV